MRSPLQGAVPAASLTAHLSTGPGRVAVDALVGRRAGLPRAVGDVDAAVLSAVMGATVESATVIGSDAGTSSRARLALAGDDVPGSVFVTLTAASAATRLMGELGRLGHTEVRCYTELAYVAALITAGLGGMQAEDVAMEGLRRGAAALDALQTVAALRGAL